MRSLLSISLYAGLLSIIACGESPEVSQPPSAVMAEIITIQEATIPVVIEVPGSVQARDRIALSSQINGFVKDVIVREGDIVGSGQLLATLDSRDAESQKAATQATIQEARAGLAEARKSAQIAVSAHSAAKASSNLADATYDRYQKLFQTRSVSPQELDEVRSRKDAAAADLAGKEAMVAAAEDRLQQAEARVLQATAQSQRTDVLLSWTVIKAPAAGKVVERMVDPGSAIFPGSPLLTLESVSSPQVIASLPTRNAPLLKRGLEVGIRFADESVPTAGRISEVIPLSDPLSHTVQFKVDLPPEFTVLSGSFAKVEIPSGTRSALLAPRSAVHEVGQLTGVFIVDSASIARYRLVKTAPYGSQQVEFLSGVEIGERIVADLSEQVTDGTPLEIR